MARDEGVMTLSGARVVVYHFYLGCALIKLNAELAESGLLVSRVIREIKSSFFASSLGSLFKMMRL